ncbi:unnamed protein product [Rhizoctonia solani]|uniref:Uncharacterized protein n=1 Tax=Rhizoctonia solani TaxID=456999 RepID=A0A8H2W9G8_9AGAM|nr:unnamed protein product [Rhizoctonia solani]
MPALRCLMFGSNLLEDSVKVGFDDLSKANGCHLKAKLADQLKLSASGLRCFKVDTAHQDIEKIKTLPTAGLILNDDMLSQYWSTEPPRLINVLIFQESESRTLLSDQFSNLDLRTLLRVEDWLFLKDYFCRRSSHFLKIAQQRALKDFGKKQFLKLGTNSKSHDPSKHPWQRNSKRATC